MPRFLIRPPCAVALFLLLAASATAAPPVFVLEAASDAVYARPHDLVLAPDGNALYVADNGNHRIAVLDPRTLALRGTFGVGEVSEPHDVAFDAAGRLLVADTGNDRIAIFAVDGDGGRLVGELRGRIRRPEGVDVHPDGRVFATGAASGNLVIFRDGAIVAESGGYSAPHDVVIDAAGAAWIADAGNDRLVRLDDTLRVTREYSGPTYGFDGPRYLDFDADGRLVVADKYTHRVLVLGPDGTLQHVLGSGRAGTGPGRFDRPEGVEIRDGTAWFSDTYNDRIVRYRYAPGAP